MAAAGSPNSPTDGYSRFTNDFTSIEGSFETQPNHRGSINKTESNEYPNELGSTNSLNRERDKDCTEYGVEMSRPGEGGDYTLGPEQHWEMNYHEAAIFLEEGENNEKFDSHPKDASALPAYLLVHNQWYHGLDLSTSVALLLLAFVEEPAVPLFRLPVGAHGSIELLCLFIIAGELALKLRWIGWAMLLKHKRTMIKCVTLVIMVAEAVTVLIRQSSHFRVTRALRPIFIVDTRHCGGVRRFIRQILQSLPPILDMMGLLLFFVSIYSLLGFYMFSDDPKDKYFSTLQDSFVSLFVLLTTANFPDVMMPSYARSKWNAVFFISYLCIVLYVLMNLMLAVVYETFTRIEREKFKKLLLHKRRACQHAFRLLVTRQDTHKIGFKQFKGLMKYYVPDKSIRDVVLMFKHLNHSDTGGLSLVEFYEIYDANMLRWEAQFSSIPWYQSTWEPLQLLCQYSHVIVNWRYFEHIVFATIASNLVAMILRTVEFDRTNLIESARLFSASWDSILFLGLYALEALLKVLGFGITRYFGSGWNVFDFTVTLLALIGVLILSIIPTFTYVVVLRPLRLIRLFKVKKRYRDVFGTVVILSPLMCSTAVVMLVMYYFFAIVGMELFAGYSMRNCCTNTTVEDFYKYSANGSTTLGYYYLNTFDDLLTSGVTLFELTVVNNWFIVMNGYVSVAHSYSRIYFIVFYLFTMVVLTIVVASVLQAFRFRIHYKRQTSKRDEERMLHEEVHLKWEELQSWVQNLQVLESLRSDLVVGGTATFIGCRPRNRDVLQRRMYRTEIEEWMREAEGEEKRAESSEGEEHVILNTDHVILGDSDHTHRRSHVTQ